jgi:xanthine dehydrogenase YagS FAD-binding subunit
VKKFTYVDAKTVQEATTALSKGKAQVLAGGTDLVTRLRAMSSPATAPDTLVNIKSITSLDYIKEESGMLKIGALTRLATIAKSSIVQSKYTALAQAAGKVGTPELRNMGTIGGNICQNVRCWYFRAEHNFFNCLRKNSSGICSALVGDNRYHSIFGAVNGCVAVNPGDTAPALVALDAKIVTSKRTLAVADFFALKGENTTVLDADEIVTEIQVPTPAAGVKSAFVKFAIRKAFDFPIVNCAAAIGGSSARVCLNAVHNLPRRVTAAEDAVKGKTIDATTAEAAGAAAVSGAVALANNKYMIQVAKTVVKRTVLACK